YSAEKNMGKTFGGFGKARNSDITEQIKDYIKAVGTTTRKLILQRFYRDIEPQALVVIEQTLQQMKCITVKIVPESNDKVYTWIGDK
ncbi:MAG: hypothetical protein ACHQWH_03830, partial [Nitrososphaerales archaeon]